MVGLFWLKIKNKGKSMKNIIFILSCLTSTLVYGTTTITNIDAIKNFNSDIIDGATITMNITGIKDTPIPLEKTFKNCTFTGTVQFVKFTKKPENITFTKMPSEVKFVLGYTSVAVPKPQKIGSADEPINITVGDQRVGATLNQKENKYYLS
jgi:hypothetical protein